jgi:hypothetical protein
MGRRGHLPLRELILPVGEGQGQQRLLLHFVGSGGTG